MGWYATDALENAFDRAVELLWPFDAGVWLKIAFLAAFSGGLGMPMNLFGGADVSETSSQDPSLYAEQIRSGLSGPMGEATNSITGAITTQEPVGATVILAGIMVAVIVLGLLVASTVFEMVFYRALMDRKVRILSPFRQYLLDGVALFGLRTGLTLLAVVSLTPLLLLASIGPSLAVLMLLIAVPVVFGWLIVFSILNPLLPLAMIDNDAGPIAALKQLYPLLQEEWQQVGLFVLLRIVAGIGVGIATMLAAVTIIFTMAVPGVLLGLLIPFAAVRLTLLALGIFLFVIVMAVFVNGPSTTYLRYYNLDVYEQLTS